MSERLKNWFHAHPVAVWVYPAGVLFTGILYFLFPINNSGILWLCLGVAGLLVFALRPNSALHAVTVERAGTGSAIAMVLTLVTVIYASLAPMDDLPIWNGEQPNHRNQYEVMAEALLEGHVDIVYGDEEELLKLENPYDPDERESSGVMYHWDHAFYKGHYYMYFGIAPVLILFLPYRAITGKPLTTYHATQIFAALTVAGLFALFHLLARRFFKKLPVSVYIALSAAFSMMSVWYASAEPALYCTAITAALAFETWSLYFFIRAVWWAKSENRQILLAFFGALFGAVTFACRPSVALANILVIPMLFAFLKQRKFTLKLLCKLCLAALPYVVVAAGLMWYNYIRFENPFEFGQKYQITVADQSKYGFSLDGETLLRVLNGTVCNFFEVGRMSAQFPYIPTTSVFFNFPMLLMCLGLIRGGTARGLRREGVLGTAWCFIAAAAVITAIDVLWTPVLLERYRMDIYFLMAAGCFIAIGFWHDSLDEKHAARLSFISSAMSVATVISSFLLYARTVGVYYPQVMAEIGEILGLE